MENQPPIGIDNEGHLVVKNRAWRRKAKTQAQLEGKPKSFYTTKQTKKRKKKNGKTVKVRKKSSK